MKGIVIFYTVFIIIMLGLVIFILPSIRGYFCAQRWESYETKYSRMVGCKIKIKGQWILENNIKLIEIK